MNTYRSTSAETDLPPLDPDGDLAGDQAAPGFGRDEVSDPACRKHRAAVLRQLSDIGVALAEQLPPLAKAQARLAEAVTDCLRRTRPEGRAALGELAVTLHRGNVNFAGMYDRICRSVRRCIMMQDHVAAALAPRASAAAGAAAPGSASRAKAPGEPAAKPGPMPTSEPERQADAESDLYAELRRELGAERLSSDLYDRPEDPTGMADLGLDRPMRELVAEICADFGVDGQIWAEKLGLGDEAAEAPAQTAGNSRSGGRRGRSDPKQKPSGAGSLPASGSARESAALHLQSRPRAKHVEGDARSTESVSSSEGPGCVTELGLGGRNRRERRAARKLARKPSAAANRRPPESGCGPP